jgi:hypothetical protein
MLKSWLLSAFALPMAFQLLVSIDERLSFGPLLERAVLHFREVSIAIWSYVANFVDINVIGIEGILTFYVILLLTCLRSGFLIVDQDRSIYKFSLEAFSQSLIVLAFSSVFSEVVWSDLLVFLIFFVGFLWSSYSFQREMMHPIVAFSVIILSLAFVYVLGTFWPNPSQYINNPYETALWGALAVSVGVVNRSVGVSNLFFTRALVFALGVFMIDFLHTKLIPTIDGFLKGAGA